MPILRIALAAFDQIFTPPFRKTLWKVLGLTLALLGLAWAGLEYAAVHYIALPWPWAATIIEVALGVGLIFGMAFLVAPISSLTAGFFLDDLAEAAESEIYPVGIRGKASPAGQSIRLSLRFFVVSAAVNFAALILFLVPGVNAFVFFVANAYLLGREYFEMAALRFDPIEKVRSLRAQHALLIFACGLPIAAFLAVPLLNLLTPLYGVAFMVRVRKMLAESQASLPLPPQS